MWDWADENRLPGAVGGGGRSGVERACRRKPSAADGRWAAEESLESAGPPEPGPVAVGSASIRHHAHALRTRWGGGGMGRKRRRFAVGVGLAG